MICISASTKFKSEIEEVYQELEKLNIPYFPLKIEVPKNQETDQMIKNYIDEHFEKIKKSDNILVINPGAYIGNSVKIEIGYAKALGKKIYYTEKTNQVELDYLADDFVSINELNKLQ
jgi:nucleoside 2-deoxyribosyltransferase